MMKNKEFKVSDWLKPQPKEDNIQPSQTVFTSNEDFEKVSKLIEQIELAKIDITADYESWLKIGFALSEAFGEGGRELFQRISSFYPKFNALECDKQFSACLKSKGQGVNIGSLFFMAKQAGIAIPIQKNAEFQKMQTDISKNEIETEVENNTSQRLPNFPDELFDDLPEFLRKITSVGETPDEKDLLLIGSIVSLSVAFPTVFGIYHNRKSYANLYLFVTAQASAGKGRLNHLRKILKPIHDSLKEEYQKAKTVFEYDLNNYNANKKNQPDLEKPQPPPMKLLFLPANNSSSGVFQLLNDNEGRGLIFETEGDTLANTFKSDFGNYSDGFRKAFHHETISFYRRTDREYVDIENPCLSAVLSGTPMQVINLIPSSEDGLFSRFIFYHLNMNAEWLDVFSANTNEGLDEYYYYLGKEFLEFYNMLLASPQIQFSFSKMQEENFNLHFQHIFNQYFTLKGEEYIGTIRRLGLITFRIAMILSALRIMDTGELSGRIICDDVDYKTAMKMSEILIVHASSVFNHLPEAAKPHSKLNKKERFFDQLPSQFSRQQYLATAADLGIQDKTAQYYIAAFKKSNLLHHDEKDTYKKSGEFS